MPDEREPRCDMTILYPPGDSEFEGVLRPNGVIARSVGLNVKLVFKRYGRNQAMAWARRFFARHRLNDWEVQDWMHGANSIESTVPRNGRI